MTNTNIVLRLSAAIALILSSPLGETFADEIDRTPALSATTPACDVALKNGDTLIGQIVNQQGVPKGTTKVQLSQNGKALAIGQSDRDGRFAFSGLKPGVYQIETPYSAQNFRAWSPATAPPVAKNGLLIVTTSDIARGQNGETYGPAIRGAVAGGLLTGFTYWALDYNPSGS